MVLPMFFEVISCCGLEIQLPATMSVVSRKVLVEHCEFAGIFRSEEFPERNLVNYKGICACIEDKDNASNIREQLSTTYGVNRLSVLDKVEHFDVCKCMPEDIMHKLLEGLVPYETKLVLKQLIDESRCFTLKELNQKIESFDYGYMNRKNKPTVITRETINGLTDAKLKQSASQMWCFFRFLPIMIGDQVDEQLENWHCFLKLWNIVQVCTAPAITKADAAYLKVIINDHHTMFKRLYPNASIIPKMHYLIHIPDEIVRFGPPRNIWTMRYEAKHSFLKGSISKNFKNVPKSLAFSHQRNMCWNLLSSPNQTMTNYLYSGDVVGVGDHNVDLHSHPYSGMIAEAAGVEQLPQPCKGSRHVKHMEIHGISYKPGCALRLEEMDEIGERDYPSYGKVEEIVVWEDRKFFVVQAFTTLAFHKHFMSYQVSPTNEKMVVVLQNLPWHGVLNIIKINGKLFIVERDISNVED